VDRFGRRSMEMVYNNAFKHNLMEKAEFSSEETYDSLFDLIYPEDQTLFVRKDAVLRTSSLCSRLLFYSSLCCGLNFSPIPLSEWHSLAIIAFPWWSNTSWGEWICLDFFRSSFEEKRVDEGGRLQKWTQKMLSFERYPEIRHIKDLHKGYYYACALALISCYLIAYQSRPPTTDILVERAMNRWGLDFMCKWANQLMGRLKASGELLEQKVNSQDLAQLPDIEKRIQLLMQLSHEGLKPEEKKQLQEELKTTLKQLIKLQSLLLDLPEEIDPLS
jgi:hypothetical protein